MKTSTAIAALIVAGGILFNATPARADWPRLPPIDSCTGEKSWSDLRRL